MSSWVKYFEQSKRNLFTHCLSNRRLIELIISETPEKGTLLEVGCGSALSSVLLADGCFNVVALDYDPEVVEYAAGRLELKRASIHYRQGDMFKLSKLFEPKQFDTIFHGGVMEHFDDPDIILGLREQRIVARQVVFSVPNSRTKKSKVHFGDERLMSSGKWISLIRQAGFGSVKEYGGYDLPVACHMVLPGAFFHRKLSFWWRFFSKHSIFVCKE